MTITNHTIFCDLRDPPVSSTPSSSNIWYEGDVQAWCWEFLGDQGLWSYNPNCQCFDSWVEEISFSFNEIS